PYISLVFSSKATSTTELYTLSLHDALPILARLTDLLEHQAVAQKEVLAAKTGHAVAQSSLEQAKTAREQARRRLELLGLKAGQRSEEHTSELQSRGHLVCRLLLEKKKKQKK